MQNSRHLKVMFGRNPRDGHIQNCTLQMREWGVERENYQKS